MIIYSFFPLSLVPPAAKEGKGDCEFPLCPPWILLLPLCNAGHFRARGRLRHWFAFSYAVHYWWAVLRYLVDMVAVLPCSDHTVASAGCGRSSVACKH